MIEANDPDSSTAKADLAFQDACQTVIARARASNTEIVIWRDGKIVELTPIEAEQELATNLAKRDSKLVSVRPTSATSSGAKTHRFG